MNRSAALLAAGWHTWYHPDYWVHQKTVADPAVQDYTNYGMSLEQAWEYETSGAGPIPSIAPAQRIISGLYRDGK